MKKGTKQVIKGIKERKRKRFTEKCKGIFYLVLLVGSLLAIACHVY